MRFCSLSTVADELRNPDGWSKEMNGLGQIYRHIRDLLKTFIITLHFSVKPSRQFKAELRLKLGNTLISPVKRQIYTEFSYRIFVVSTANKPNKSTQKVLWKPKVYHPDVKMWQTALNHWSEVGEASGWQLRVPKVFFGTK